MARQDMRIQSSTMISTDTHTTAVNILEDHLVDNESGLEDSCCYDTRLKHVLVGGHKVVLGHPVDGVEETTEIASGKICAYACDDI